MKENILVEVLKETCPYCVKEVAYVWAESGGVMSSRHYCLVADWVYHSECWDKLIEEHPP